jgi:CelD/BcsL family acetyltransferase involved in cellulose biosynthesis
VTPTRLIGLADLVDSDREAWRELARHAEEPNPFFEPEMVEPAWRNLRPRRLALLVATDAAGWTGCVPVRPLAPRDLVLCGWRHPYSFVGTPLLRRGETRHAAQSLLDTLQRRQSLALALPLVRRGRVHEALLAAAGEAGLDLAWERASDRGAVRRVSGDGEQRLPLTARRRSELRRSARRLGEALGGPVEVHDQSDDPQAVSRFMALEASGWKGRNGTALSSDPRHQAFFEEMAAAFAREGRMLIRALGVRGTVLAMNTQLAAGDELFGFKAAFDERYQRYGPGTQLMYDTVVSFQAGPARVLFDSCSDENSRLANDLFGDRVELSSLVLAARGLPASAVRHGTRAIVAFGARRAAAIEAARRPRARAATPTKAPARVRL